MAVIAVYVPVHARHAEAQADANRGSTPRPISVVTVGRLAASAKATSSVRGAGIGSDDAPTGVEHRLVVRR